MFNKILLNRNENSNSPSPKQNENLLNKDTLSSTSSSTSSSAEQSNQDENSSTVNSSPVGDSVQHSIKNLAAGFYHHHLNPSAFMPTNEYHHNPQLHHFRSNPNSQIDNHQMLRHQIDYHPHINNPFDHHVTQLTSTMNVNVSMNFNSTSPTALSAAAAAASNSASMYYNHQNGSNFGKHYSSSQQNYQNNVHHQPLGIQLPQSSNGSLNEQERLMSHQQNQNFQVNSQTTNGLMNIINNGPPSSSSTSTNSISSSASPPLNSNESASPATNPAVVAAIYHSAINAGVTDPFQASKLAAASTSYSYNNAHMHHPMFTIPHVPLSTYSSNTNSLSAANHLNTNLSTNVDYSNYKDKFYQNEFLTDYEKR